MKTTLFTALLLAILATAQAQTRNTLIMKPGPDCGEDANIATNVVAALNWQNTNYGSQPELRAIAWTWSAIGGGAGTIRGLVDFRDLDLVPTGATVQSATLRLYGLPSSSGFTPANSGANVGWVQRITGTWGENAVTWNTQPTATATNQVAVPASTSTWNYDVALNVTNLVQDMVNLSAANRFGFLFSLQTEVRYRSLVFASSDNGDPNLWPELEVVYTYACAQPRPNTAVDDMPRADDPATLGTFEVFPNPGTGLVHLSFDGSVASEAVIQVTNTLGQTVKQANINTVQGMNRHEMDLSDLPAGNYNISIRFADPTIDPIVKKVLLAR